MVVVTSNIQNWKQRKAIRDSWGLWLNGVSDINSMSMNHQLASVLADDDRIGLKSTTEDIGRLETSNKSKVTSSFAQLNATLKFKLVFLLGREIESNQLSEEISQEQNMNGDLLVEDFIDSYQNLTIKSCFILKYVQDKCPGVKFVAKIDDDVFLHIPNLLNMLLDKSLPEKLMLGFRLCNRLPIRNPSSKWYSPNHMFAGAIYPNYLSGSSYIISGNIISQLLEAALVTPLFHMEDVYVTGILAASIRVHPINHISLFHPLRTISPCHFKVSVLRPWALKNFFSSVAFRHVISPRRVSRNDNSVLLIHLVKE